MEPTSCLRLRLCGRVRLVDSQGREIAVASAKAQALLALLGTAPELRRQRAFIQDKLWSESEPEKGSASLRQLLTVMRRALGPWRDVLLAAPGWVGLDPAMVSVSLDPEPSDWGLEREPPEFAAGLDIRDPEFEDWLRDQRMVAEDRIAAIPPPDRPLAAQPVERPPPRTLIAIAPPSATDSDLLPLAELIADEIAAQIRSEVGPAVRFSTNVADGAAPLTLAVRAANLGGQLVLQAAWHDGTTGERLTAARRSVRQGGRGGTGPFDELVAETAVAALVTLQQRGVGPSLGLMALNSVPVLADPDSSLRVDRLLEAASGELGALAHAQRAQLRVVAAIERFGTIYQDVHDEAAFFVARAMDAAPTNPTVKAVAAEVALYLDRSPQKAITLAQAARTQAPASAIAAASFARALAFTGDQKRAHAEALRALRLANGHPRLASWQMFCSMTALRCGLLDQAEMFAEMAHQAIPDFRPPLRVLATLRWHRGDHAGAASALQKLKQAEPDFDLAMMADPDYPTFTLQSIGLTGVASSGLL